MKSWSYFISIPAGAGLCFAYWWHIISTINSGMFDALAAWIICGIVIHGFLIGISYHAYRTLTGTWLKSQRGKSIWQKLKEKREKKKS
ncbi:MAG: hypothetical protein SLAVMIC_00433 [uncultured marine phage]|uniref:Uncharacterized protein n=1 Tax=uncultured marine phage TaxID=707152 RepID=A0A8D9FR25_9VIRU|nr:MAG: hypothetical protein SLAVMIC_00433 [uncultured marine phage]